MAPEILRYEKYDAKADLWSVGAVLYETAFGRPPFRAQNHIELLKKIESTTKVKFPDEDPAFFDKHPDNKPVPNDIKKLIRSLLKRFPAERASFDEFFNSTALERSKFPRPSMKGSASANSPSSSKTAAHQFALGNQEAVIVGTMQKRQKPSTIIEMPPSSGKNDDGAHMIVAPPKVTFRRRGNSEEENGPPGIDLVSPSPRGGR